MGFQVLQFKPGISRESTKLTNQGNYYASDKIRFRSGYPQKIGGWVNGSPYVILGVCREMTEWALLDGGYLQGLGTNLKYYINYGGTLWDVTPVNVSLNLTADPFSTMWDTLSASITDKDDVIPVTDILTDNFGILAPYVIQIDDEQIYVPAFDVANSTLGVAGDKTKRCFRGWNNTVKAPHAAGTPVTSSWVLMDAPNSLSSRTDFVTIQGATGFSNLSAKLLNSDIMVQANNNTYVLLDYQLQSTAAASGGGASVVADFALPSGLAYGADGLGWGAGPYSRDGWGQPCRPGQGGILIGARQWSASNFGQDLVYNPKGYQIFYWSAGDYTTDTGVVTGKGVDINTLTGSDMYAPEQCNFVLCTDERHIVAFGCNNTTGGVSPDQNTPLDPMFIAWSDQNTPLIWNPQIQNLAGNYRLSYGTKITAVSANRQEVLVWTDTALYSMRYLGAPFVYGFFPLNTNITMTSRNGWATANGNTYWMGHKKFYVYNGSVQTLPCTLRQYVFDDINETQWDQVYCSTNEEYNEIWWFYCSKLSPVIDRYVVYNHLENLWYYGTMNRTAWLDSHIRQYPYAVTNLTIDFDPKTGEYLPTWSEQTSKYVARAGIFSANQVGQIPQIIPHDQPLQQLLQHEFGNDDGSTIPKSAIYSYIATGDFDIGEGGEHFAFVNRIIPDIDFIGSDILPGHPEPNATMTINAQDYPGVGTNTDAMQTAPAYVQGKGETIQVYSYTGQVWIRLRGRLLSFQVSSDGLGVAWQLGSPRLSVRLDGRRGLWKVPGVGG